jgi:hypothetical protein
METQHYFNTTNETAKYVDSRVAKNQTQEEIVYDIFLAKRKLSASEVMALYPNKNVPLTSIRRCLSNLFYDGKLIKLEETNIGIFGSPEKKYRLAYEVNQQITMF